METIGLSPAPEFGDLNRVWQGPWDGTAIVSVAVAGTLPRHCAGCFVHERQQGVARPAILEPTVI